MMVEIAVTIDLSRRDLLIRGALLATSTVACAPHLFAKSASAREPAKPLTADGNLAYQNTEELVAALASRRVSSLELVDNAIKRIESLDSYTNAVVVRDFDKARSAAAAADAALSRGNRAPLLGVPMTVKESFNIGGLPTTWGIPAAKGWLAAKDAEAVARLKSAGAIILGKTNLPIMISDWQSYNDVYGTTNNPWDFGRTPGGSSGGSAATLAAGFVSLELGSDINGSIRCPAHFCGVFGHKPTPGLIPLHGHVPPKSNPFAADGSVGLGVCGPMARSARDLARALDVMAGPDAAQSMAYRLVLPRSRHDTLANFRVLVLDTHPLLPTAASVRAAIERLSERLFKLGSKVAHGSPSLPDLADAARLHQKILFSFSQAFGSPDFYKRIESKVAALAPDDNSLTAWRLRGAILSHRDWIAANSARDQLRQQWHEVFREWDVVVCPIMPTTAFAHDHTPDQEDRHIDIDGEEYPYRDQSVWPGMATTPGLPATVVPVDQSEDGLPIGVQIIGPYLEDHTTIKFAGLIEREFGGFVAPPKFKG